MWPVTGCNVNWTLSWVNFEVILLRIWKYSHIEWVQRDRAPPQGPEGCSGYHIQILTQHADHWLLFVITDALFIIDFFKKSIPLVQTDYRLSIPEGWSLLTSPPPLIVKYLDSCWTVFYEVYNRQSCSRPGWTEMTSLIIWLFFWAKCSV